MLLLKNILPVYGSAGGPSGAAGSPPAEPPTNPTDANPEKIGEADEWILGHFDALNADENSEDLDPVEPLAPVEIPSQVSAQAGRPEGVSPPSQQTGEIPPVLGALATPAQDQVASPPPVPVVGASANQPVVSPPSAQTPALDPSLIMSQLAEGIQQQREGFIKQLAETQYAISEKQADDLGLSPEAAKLWALQMAAVHVNTTASITRMQAEQLPVFLNGQLNARSENQRKEDQFFGQWPGLRQAPKDSLAKVFQAVNQLHPDLRGDAWFKKAGELAHVSLGIPIQQPAASNGQAGQPQPQAIRTPGPIVRQVNGLSHLPAGTSTAPAPIAQQKSESERFFELLQATDAGAFDQ